MRNSVSCIPAALDKVFRKSAKGILLLLLSLLSVGVSASTFSVIYNPTQNRIVVTLNCSSYCDYYKKVGSSWSLISSPWQGDGELTYTYIGPAPGEHEFKLETGGYTNTGWGVVEVDQGSAVVPAGEGQVTSYQYDALGRLKKVTRPAGTATNYGYDDADNRTSKTVAP